MLHLLHKCKILYSLIILVIFLTPSYFPSTGSSSLIPTQTQKISPNSPSIPNVPSVQNKQNSEVSILPYIVKASTKVAPNLKTDANPKIAINNLTNLKTASSIQSLNKATSFTNDYTMGSVQKFWVENLYFANNGKDNNGDGKTFAQGDWAEAMYQINASLINITQHAYIFVDENSKYYSDYVNGLAAQIGQVFETNIYPSDSKLGTPIEIGQYNQNDKIIILIFDFIEGNLHPGYYTTGYFWPVQMHKPSINKSSIYYYSNYKEIININSVFMHNQNNNVNALAPTLAHEYFHLIHYNYNTNEDLWLEEGLAVFAENLAGYKSGYISYLEDTQGYFLHAFDESLTYFRETLESYGESFLFVLYLNQRLGLDFIRDIVHFTNRSGIDAIKYELSVKDSSLSFNQVYSDWVITNVINDQTSKTYSYENFSYNISSSQYNLDNKLKIVPTQFTNQILPYWSNQFYTLPKSDLEPYLVTFFPDLPNNDSQYQLTVVTMNNENYQFTKEPLINDQSGSFMVQYENNSQNLLKLLIISSLTGTSSGGNQIEDSQMFITYFSRYNLYLNFFSYRLDFKLDNPGSFYPSYSFILETPNGQILQNNEISLAKINIYNWNTNQKVSGSTGNIPYDSATKSWVIGSNEFQNLALGQYYFNVTIALSNGTSFTLQGLTFLLGNGNSTNSNSSKFSLSYAGLVIFLPLFVIMAIVRGKRRNI